MKKKEENSGACAMGVCVLKNKKKTNEVK